MCVHKYMYTRYALIYMYIHVRIYIYTLCSECIGLLQDAVPPFSNAEAYKCIEAELGRPLSEVFSEIAESRAGSASLAQVCT